MSRRWLSSIGHPLPDCPNPSMASCELYIVRHAIAADRGEAWPDDTKRPLTTRGINRFKESVGGLKWLDATIDENLHEPARACETDSRPAGGGSVWASSGEAPGRACTRACARGGDGPARQGGQAAADCARGPRARPRGACGAPRRREPPARVQEGRYLPDRCRRNLGPSNRIARLVRDAQGPAQNWRRDESDDSRRHHQPDLWNGTQTR
jgi:hypothetical protein